MWQRRYKNKVRSGEHAVKLEEKTIIISATVTKVNIVLDMKRQIDEQNRLCGSSSANLCQ